ncbi:MAG: YdeI/OmpD-associated family protein [Gemmatimonadales bacterium]|nr:YdeI/OmpD-associated family protein [Gemmatimonadales bacterium]
MAPTPKNPKYFRSPAAFRAWLEQHHDSAEELWVGFYKKHTGKQGMTWSEAVDQALCFGWIDSIVRRVDDERHVQRFTPRRPGSVWSKVNVTKITQLKADGLMHPAGLAPFEARGAEHQEGYSIAERDAELAPAYQKQFKANTRAWNWWQAQTDSYRRNAAHWVMDAKREATRERRLAQLIADAAAGLRIKQLRPLVPKGRQPGGRGRG